MSNTPSVYSEHDRHQLLLSIAKMVAEEVKNNPAAHETEVGGDYYANVYTHSVSSK